MRYLITLVAPENGTVLDPFNGSGSTGLGALQCNRNYIGIEMDERYCEITKNRLKELEKELDTPANKLFD